MRKLAYYVVLTGFVTTIHATIPEVDIQDQSEAQKLCVEQIVNTCIDKCRDANDVGCVQLCHENAKNQCRQAGE